MDLEAEDSEAKASGDDVSGEDVSMGEPATPDRDSRPEAPDRDSRPEADTSSSARVFTPSGGAELFSPNDVELVRKLDRAYPMPSLVTPNTEEALGELTPLAHNRDILFIGIELAELASRRARTDSRLRWDAG